jgi:hypothetical protein
MLPTEQAQFFTLVGRSLNAYGKFPEQRELMAWWDECRNLSLEALQTALKSHRDDPDRGERAPRPVDITRRMKTGTRDAQRCTATDHTGQCQYPGIFSEGTAGEGPWYCPWHRQERAGPEASRWIERSRDVPYEVARAKRIERMNAEGQHTMAVTDTAHAIALRHGGRPWQSRIAEFIPAKFQQDEAA